MAWDFETDKEYQVLLDWAEEFMTNKVEPLDMVLGSAMEYQDPTSSNWYGHCSRKLRTWAYGRATWARNWVGSVLVN